MRKAAKNYEPDTTLIIWLRDEPPALGKRLQDKDLHRDILQLSDGVFANVCCVGLKTGISWLLGTGL